MNVYAALDVASGKVIADLTPRHRAESTSYSPSEASLTYLCLLGQSRRPDSRLLSSTEPTRPTTRIIIGSKRFDSKTLRLWAATRVGFCWISRRVDVCSRRKDFESVR
jgi:hypothetical protein